jgi:hypothetical protein
MTGDRYRRGDVLGELIATANRRQDGALPLDVPGVEAVFDDIDDLVGALLLRWHTRLAGELERALASQPLDLEEAVIRGWRSTRDRLVGVRVIMDALTEQRISPQMSAKLRVTAHKDWALMAIMAGQVSYHDERAISVGRRIEAKARTAEEPEERPDGPTPPAPRSILARIRAALVA